MASLGSPERETANDIAAWVPDRSGGDFGYSAGAMEIHGRFADRLVDARRRLPRHERSFAIRALRDERDKELGALRERCAQRRRDWHLADREIAARRRVTSPKRPRTPKRMPTSTPA